MSKKPLEVEVWGAKVLDLMNYPGVKVEFVKYRGCDNESCGHIEHDPIDKVYRVTFPEGTKIKKEGSGSTEYALPDGPTVRITHGGDFHDKVVIIDAKKTKTKEPKMGLG